MAYVARAFVSVSLLSLSSRADDDFSGPMDTNVRLRYDGEITWDAPAITKSSCVVDVSYFPFDSQECNLTFGSWTYNGNQVWRSPSTCVRVNLPQFSLSRFSG